MNYKFKNNAREEFNFFLNKDGYLRLDITFEEEQLASFLLSKEELDGLIKSLKGMTVSARSIA